MKKIPALIGLRVIPPKKSCATNFIEISLSFPYQMLFQNIQWKRDVKMWWANQSCPISTCINFISNSRSVKGYWGISVFSFFSHHLNLSPMDNCGKGIWQMWGNCWSLQLLIWIISTLYLSFHIARIRYAATSSFSVTNATSTGNRARLFLCTFVFTPSRAGHFFTSIFVTCKNPSSAA